MPTESPLRERIERLQNRIHIACRRAGRNPTEVKLMAVSKTRPASAIQEAAAAGVLLFGENRVQEFQQKSADLKALKIQPEVHLIGHLQSNKAAKAAEIFSAIDTVDSLRIAQRLNEAAARLSRTIPILLEIKLSTEETKTGLAPGSPDLSQLLEQLPKLKNLSMRGLMTVAPLDQDPEAARLCFRSLHTLRDQLAPRHPQLDFRELSMGMSGDFEIAIEEGSTLVRIGTAIFGTRTSPA
jgi:pyridoxal phosphate enzyme (YggS family)